MNFNLPPESIKQTFRYDPKTGEFFRMCKEYEKKAGSVDAYGYLVINHLGKLYEAHRLAYWFVTGEMPTSQIDHINGDRLDNSFKNLRPADPLLNARNRKACNSTNQTGQLGVHYAKDKGKYRATICRDYRIKHLGYFNTLEEAKDAYEQAKIEEN